MKYFHSIRQQKTLPDGFAGQIPQCYKVEVQESEGNIVIYEKDAVANEKTPAAGETE
ncbi:6-pyruvoyl tetrahydrobiopterin synthase [Bacteroides thetaiotaomicron]|nr:6-pyruvoyl tetrahydrobiopterin synthase [Bacteroides thetaiotaomicron]